MAILHILHYPDPRLRIKAMPVERVESDIRQLLDDMLETMYDAPGVGLAAPQVDIPKRVIVVDISEQKNAPLCLINPEIISQEDVEQMEEGCLSVPGVYEIVERAARIKVKALDRNGTPLELDVGGVLAVCIQHEIDHLEGKLFVDYLSEMRRNRIRKKMDKQRRHAM
ncbi:MAG TPA: peptide deformylase [Gammaproteobacteria bacterium]